MGLPSTDVQLPFFKITWLFSEMLLLVSEIEKLTIYTEPSVKLKLI